MITKGKIAIIGRTNVGKSSLFNRIIGQNITIVHEESGITRDRIYHNACWRKQVFTLIDVGGFNDSYNNLTNHINEQATKAISEADIILFMICFQSGITAHDWIITKKLHQIKKPVILVCNKYDNPQIDPAIHEYQVLGFNTPILISVAHGIGIGDLLDKILDYIQKLPAKENTKSSFTFSIIGQTNVGKSTLVNSILKKKRVIVSDQACTTTDSVRTNFCYHNQIFTIIDTAGINKKITPSGEVDYYGQKQTKEVIFASNLVILLLDGNKSLTNTDKKNLNHIIKAKKPLIIVINKCDLFLTAESKNYDKIKKQIKYHFPFLHHEIIVFISALKTWNINTILTTINHIKNKLQIRIKTHPLNQIIRQAMLFHPPHSYHGGKLVVYYITQVLGKIPTFVLKINKKKYLANSYQRFLEKQICVNFQYKSRNFA